MSLRFLAILFVALALIPGGAHLLELPNKIHMSANSYRIVQELYRGWAFAGIVLIAALAATFALMLAQRPAHDAFIAAMIAFICLCATLVIFWAVTFPVNSATKNWSVLPENWQQLRARWEYSHAVNSVLTFVALIAVIWSALAYKPEP